MKTILQISNRLPAWQRERAEILQRACRSLKGWKGRGESLHRAGKIVARRYHGLAFECEPSRELQLRPSTLRRLFRVWTRSGETAAAFRLNYIHGRQSVFTSGILTRFLQFIIDRPQPSLAVAWKKFCERGGSFGPGRRAGKPLHISYFQIRWAFPASWFQEIRAQQKIMAAAQARIKKIQFETDLSICAKYPERPLPRRMRRGTDFQT